MLSLRKLLEKVDRIIANDSKNRNLQEKNEVEKRKKHKWLKVGVSCKTRMQDIIAESVNY